MSTLEFANFISTNTYNEKLISISKNQRRKKGFLLKTNISDTISTVKIFYYHTS